MNALAWLGLLLAGCGSNAKPPEPLANKPAETKATATPPRETGRVPDVLVQLNKLAKEAKIVFVETAAYPAGTIGPTPTMACCKEPGGTCPVVPDWYATIPSLWTELDFQLNDPTLFQYSVESDGTKLIARAVGDLDCDGATITYELVMDVVDGNPRARIMPPPPNID